MASDPDARLRELGIELPEAPAPAVGVAELPMDAPVELVVETAPGS